MREKELIVYRDFEDGELLYDIQYRGHGGTVLRVYP